MLAVGLWETEYAIPYCEQISAIHKRAATVDHNMQADHTSSRCISALALVFRIFGIPSLASTALTRILCTTLGFRNMYDKEKKY